MEFKLNEYNWNISDEELLLDIKRIADELKVKALSVTQYNANGKYNASTIQRRFHGWFGCCA